MKFTKDQATQALSAKFKDKEKDLDLSRTINENVDNVLKIIGDNEEMELSDFVSKVEPLVTTAVGLMRHETSTTAKGLQDKIAELEKKIKDQTPTPTPPKGDEESELAKRIATLEKQLADNQKQEKISGKKKELKSKIAEKVKNEDWVNTMLGLVSIDEDSDVDAKSNELIEAYNKFKSTNPNDEPPMPPKGGGDDKQTKQLLDSVAQCMPNNYGENKEN